MANDPKNDPKQEMKDMVREIIEATLPAAVAAVSAGNTNARQRQIEQQVASQRKCADCGQLEAACKKKHVQMVVFVGGPYARWFQGCKLNGINYLSNHEGHAITVPAENEFGHQMELFRKNEERFQTGRVFEHNSGIISPAGQGGFNPNHGPRY